MIIFNGHNGDKDNDNDDDDDYGGGGDDYAAAAAVDDDDDDDMTMKMSKKDRVRQKYVWYYGQHNQHILQTNDFGHR